MRKKRLLLFLGISLAIPLVLYLARRPLFESMIIARVESTLSEVLGAQVEVSAIRGNWLTAAVVEGVEIRGGEASAYREIRGVRIEAEFSPFALMSGDLTGLHKLRVTGKRVVLHLDKAWSGGVDGETNDTSEPGPSLAYLLAIVEAGGTVEIDELVLSPDYIGAGPHKVVLSPGSGPREVVVNATGTGITGRITPEGNYSVRVTGEGAGRVLRASGIVRDAVDDGELSGRIEGDTTRSAVDIQLVLATTLESGTDIGIGLQLTMEASRLRVPSLNFDLPGFAVVGHDVDLPVAALFGGDLASALSQVSGRLEARVSDLVRYRSMLPATVQTLLPITGDLAIDVREGDVHLRESVLRGKGLGLRVTAGSFSLLDLPLKEFSLDRLRATSARGIEFELTMTEELALELPETGVLECTGSVKGSLAGNLGKPSATARVRLRRVALGEYRIAEFDSSLAFDGGRLSLDKLRVRDIKREVDSFGIAVDGAAALYLPAAAGAAPKIAFDLRGDVPPELLAEFDVAPKVVESVSLPTAAISGELHFPNEEGVRGSLRVEFPGIRAGRLAPIDLLCEADIASSGDVEIRTLDLRSDVGEFTASGTITRETLDIRARGAVTQLLPICRQCGWHSLRGNARIESLTVKVPLAVLDAVPDVAIDCDVTLTEIDRAWFAPERRGELPTAPLALKLSARASGGDVSVKRLQVRWGREDKRFLGLETSGVVPLRWSRDGGFAAAQRKEPLETLVRVVVAEPYPGQPRVELECPVRVNAKDVRIPTLSARSAGGTLKGTGLRVGLDLDELLAGTLTVATLPIAGAIELHGYTFGSVLSTLIGGKVRGLASGKLVVDGHLYRPTLSGSIKVEDGAYSRAGAPALRDVQLRANFTDRSIQMIHRAEVVDGERVEVTANLSTGRQALWSEDAAVRGDLTVRGLDLSLLSRLDTGVAGVHGILTVDATVAGTFKELQPKVTLDIVGGGWQPVDGPAVEGFSTRVELTRHRADIKHCKAKVLGFPFSVTADLAVNGAALWEVPTERHRAAPLTGHANFSDLPLAMVPKQLIDLRDLNGIVGGTMTLAGSWADPRPKLHVDLRDASCKVSTLPRLGNLIATIDVDPSRCVLQGNGTLGAEEVNLNGVLTAGAGVFPDSYANAALDARIDGKRLLLLRNRGVKVRGDIDLTAKGKLDALNVGGVVTLADSKYVRRLSLIPDLQSKGGATSGDIFGPWVIPGGEGMTFDVKIETREPFVARTNVLDGDFEVVASLEGPGSGLYLVGSCSTRGGIVRFPGMRMKLQGMRFGFSRAHPTRPEVTAIASGRRHGVRIRMRVKGPWDDPVVSLTSTPTLQSKELWSLLMTGVRPESLATNDAQSNTGILATYVLQELLLTYLASESTEEQQSFVSRFTFEFGSELSREGQETWQVDFDLGGLWNVPPSFGLRVEQDVYEDVNMGLVYRWRF